MSAKQFFELKNAIDMCISDINAIKSRIEAIEKMIDEKFLEDIKARSAPKNKKE